VVQKGLCADDDDDDDDEDDWMIVDNKFESTWKAVAVTYFKAFCCHFAGGTEEIRDRHKTG
jgi:hypothetical protein